ncbi:MAG: hypothetical protein JNL57_05880 [Bacteroidetes bacterium]|nr:hypothetical protein [Bacteroidota bacterium]
MKHIIHRFLALITLSLTGMGAAWAQTTFADFRVKTTDQDGRNLSGVRIAMMLEGIEVASDTTDSDGNALFQTLQPGNYKIMATKEGLPDKTFERELTTGLNTPLEIQMGKDVVVLPGAEVFAKRKSVIDIEKNEKSVSNKQLLNGSNRGIGAITSTNSAVLATAQGISVRGTRADGNRTFVDGVMVIGSGAVSTLGTEQISVNIGGIPAQYGDLTGGAFSYTTRSASERLVTALEGITSTGLDPYGMNTLSGFVSGPLWVQKYKDEAGTTKKIVKLGFTMNADLGYYKDPSPVRTGVYQVKEEKLKEIEQNPLIPTPTGFVHAATNLRMSDFDHLKYHPNSPLYTGSGYGKLEFRPNNLITVTGFASYYYSQGLGVSSSIMNQAANGRSDATTLRSYLQFTQNFKTDKKSSIKSAFYTIRAEYQNASSNSRDAKHLDNVFDYGYLGSFTSYPTPVFAYSDYDAQQNPNKDPKIVRDQYGRYVQLRNYWEQVGYADTLMTFAPSDLNPVRARYTQSIYDYYNSRGFKISNFQQIQNSLGLLNGYNPSNVYSLWGTPGANASGWSKSNSEKYSVFAMGQMQVKPKTVGGRERTPHDLQAGFYYEQLINRGYGLGANGLWILMNQLMNKHISNLDKDNPILSYDANGVFMDTVRYNRLVNYGEQSHFDRAFREKLIKEGAVDVYGKPVDERTFVDINSYKPGDFKLDMFNADELLNNGNGYVSYFGYDYLGRKQRGKPAIEDFLNNRDQRTIGAFQPVYMAAWLQDQFQFKDLIFRMGLRMERYDANQSVLKDPYSLYAIKTAGEVNKINGLAVSHPDNIGSDFKVYVNDIQAPTKIVGYRNGDKWYNADGSEQRSSEFLANQTSNGKIAPLLVKPDVKDQVLTKESLRDFIPAINLLPRIWFSFPLEPRKKTFYVSYDVLAQRPNSGASFLSIDELYFLKNRQGSTISNGDLKSRIKTDYEVGYKQIFGKKANKGLELAASYSEIRNDFGLYQISNGYPSTYTTYRNIDFATITGFRASYIMENIGPLSFQCSYMLQFADGTGSNINSQAALIASNQPNLRNVIPLGELDIRHNIKASATWAWGGGFDPVRKKSLYIGPAGLKKLLEYASLNVIGNTYSGGPYTPTTRPVQIGAVDRAQIKGVPYGARLPWQYTLDMNFTKGFSLKRAGKDNPLVFNVFLWVNNVLNTKNVVGVFPYTGQADDDGFLNSPQGKLAVQNQINAQSYTDLYKILLNSQAGNWGSPRTVRLGVRINFN